MKKLFVSMVVGSAMFLPYAAYAIRLSDDTVRNMPNEKVVPADSRQQGKATVQNDQEKAKTASDKNRKETLPQAPVRDVAAPK